MVGTLRNFVRPPDNKEQTVLCHHCCQFVPWQTVAYISIFPANTISTEKDTMAGGI